MNKTWNHQLPWSDNTINTTGGGKVGRAEYLVWVVSSGQQSDELCWVLLLLLASDSSSDLYNDSGNIRGFALRGWKRGPRSEQKGFLVFKWPKI